MHWVDFKTRDLQKAAGYRDSRPIPVSAVYVARPFNHRKERFKSVSTPVLRQAEDSFAPGLLTDFVAAIRQAQDDWIARSESGMRTSGRKRVEDRDLR